MAVPIELTKHEGLGNDFLIAIDPARPLTASDAVSWCDRRRGIGADGLIELRTQPDDEPTVMTLFNADGSRAEISGNGVRCAGQALVRHAGLNGSQVLDIATDAGQRRLEVDASVGRQVAVRVDMGPAKPGPPDSTAWSDLGVTLQRQMGIDMGNPHLVALVDDPDAYDIAVVGAAVEAGYPAGLNVHLIAVADPVVGETASIELRVWERGAGVTEACGSGACAAGYAALSWGLVTGPVQVQMPGGAAVVEVEDDTIFLTGPATYVAAVTVED